MKSRYNKITNVIQNEENLSNFDIPLPEINRMLTDIDNEIESWNGVEMHLCKKKKTTFKAYKRTATNWFNRNKAKIFGNHFFYPLIFKYLLNVCINL